MNCDVLIIGGGVIGLSIARELHNRGTRRITVVDRGKLGCEASWAAAGMLAPNIETDASEDFRHFGTESLDAYPNFAASLFDETGVDIELDRSGTLCLAFDESDAGKLAEIYRQQSLRNVRVEQLASAEILSLDPEISPAAHAALFYPNDWQVENRKLIVALRRFAETRDIRIVENTEISELLNDGRRVRGAQTLDGELLADTTVLATGAWTSLIKIGNAAWPIPVKPIRGQMISFASNEKLLRHVVYSRRGYVVPRADGRLLVGATVEDVGFDKSTTSEGIDLLQAAGIEIAPAIANLPIAETWAGLRPFAFDGLPVLGNVPDFENVLVATAHYRNGILLAPKTAEIIADKILTNTTSQFLELYDVGRLSPAASIALAK